MPGRVRCCCDLVASYFFATLWGKMLTFASWSVKHICFVRCHFFRSFFSSWISTTPLQITANSYFRRVSCWWNAHLCANPIIYYVSGTIFPRRPASGRVSLERCANFTFSFFVFSFWPLFFILFFGLSKVLDSYQITAFGSRWANLLPSLGGLWGARRELFFIVILHIFIKNIWNIF